MFSSLGIATILGLLMGSFWRALSSRVKRRVHMSVAMILLFLLRFNLLETNVRKRVGLGVFRKTFYSKHGTGNEKEAVGFLQTLVRKTIRCR
jgi:hypothetical protein